jgi:hypothetical protein
LNISTDVSENFQYSKSFWDIKKILITFAGNRIIAFSDENELTTSARSISEIFSLTLGQYHYDICWNWINYFQW